MIGMKINPRSPSNISWMRKRPTTNSLPRSLEPESDDQKDNVSNGLEESLEPDFIPENGSQTWEDG